MQAVENPIRTDVLCQMMPVQVGLQVRLHMRKHQLDALLRQLLLQFPNDARGGVIHVSDGSGIHDQPAQPAVDVSDARPTRSRISSANRPAFA